MPAAAELPPTDDEAVEPVLSRRKLEEADMDITPMIDMTFLLLIFFIVTSKMGPKAGVELPNARHGGAVVEKNAVILTVGPGDPIARVYRGESVDDKDAFGGANAEDQEREIIDYVEKQFAASGGSKEHVLIQAGKGLKHREVARVAKAVARAEVEKRLHVGVVEKK
jgi:biopolymer transport protein ExbD